MAVKLYVVASPQSRGWASASIAQGAASRVAIVPWRDPCHANASLPHVKKSTSLFLQLLFMGSLLCSCKMTEHVEHHGPLQKSKDRNGRFLDRAERQGQDALTVGMTAFTAPDPSNPDPYLVPIQPDRLPIVELVSVELTDLHFFSSIQDRELSYQKNEEGASAPMDENPRDHAVEPGTKPSHLTQ